jgi:hypothetical protein
MKLTAGLLFTLGCFFINNASAQDSLKTFKSIEHESLRILNVEKFELENNKVKVAITYELPCYVTNSDIQEIKFYSNKDDSFYLGLTFPSHTKFREIFCLAFTEKTIEMFLKKKTDTTTIKVLNY